MTGPNLLIIGAGGVGDVVANKAVQFRERFGTITWAARTPKKLAGKAAVVNGRYGATEAAPFLSHEAVDARDTDAVAALIEKTGAKIVLNVASPYCNVAISDACLKTGASYLDTALAEDEFTIDIPPNWYEHKEWPRRPEFKAKGVTALLGMGFDPGVVNIFCSWARKHHFDAIDSIDIIDVNAGNHGKYFATNFDPDVNLREVTEEVITWEDGEWKFIPHHSVWQDVTLPLVGEQRVYSMGHDEVQSLAVNFPDTPRITFWMGFGEHYMKVLEVLDTLGLTSSVPVEVDGQMVAPNRVVKALLPDPASLAENYTGKIVIGVDIRGKKDGQDKRLFIWSTLDHKENYEEVGAQSISYSTGVPVITAALLMADGTWDPKTMVNVEELDPDPFLALMPEVGCPWQADELPADGSWPYADGEGSPSSAPLSQQTAATDRGAT
ncbi:saccharopine dehydrogenase family protein [Notoacmeibacter sp. MSK16QG-6]|uniref:saccharopine dehydrogenase family protein n=1 Tax=Notoacmeibacter sp. MSK16QG-6 TaxID=2957982 RepID=UPI00209F54CF|nr:saccharopine dehydrogenase family protein [Notoacmeibacter sp. MSK16QG-6]MCP1199972.1 saccharopine dehydrogenase family protein [Notoacmeibacter sp. MSK16QG-6]